MSESIRITEISWRRSYLCLEYEGPEDAWPVLEGKAGTFPFLPDEQAALYVTPREGHRYAFLSLVNVEQGNMLPEGSYELRARQEKSGEELALTFAPTPGKTTRSAARTTAGSDVTTVSTPSASNASFTLVRFPAL